MPSFFGVRPLEVAEGPRSGITSLLSLCFQHHRRPGPRVLHCPLVTNAKGGAGVTAEHVRLGQPTLAEVCVNVASTVSTLPSISSTYSTCVDVETCSFDVLVVLHRCVRAGHCLFGAPFHYFIQQLERLLRSGNSVQGCLLSTKNSWIWIC